MLSIVVRLRTTGRELWRDGRGRILVAVSAGWLLSLGTRLVYPAIIPYIRADFGMDLATVGLLLSLLWAAYALGQFPGGLLGDAVGERNVLVLSTAVAATTIVIVSASVSAWMLFTGTILFGFATALYGPTRFTVFSDIYSERMGTAIGLSMAAGSFGNALFPVAAVLIATRMTWRASFAVLLPLFAVISIVLWFVVPKRTSTSHAPSDARSIGSPREIFGGLTRGSIPLFVGIQFTMSLVYQGFIGFYPTYLIVVKGLSPGWAAALFGLFFAIGVLVQPLAGGSMDHFGTRRSLVFTLGLVVVSLLLLPVASGLVQLLGLTVVLSCIAGYGAITQTFIADAIPNSMKGTGLGLLRSGWILFGSLSPVVIGVLGDRGYLSEAFVALGIIAAVALTLSLFAPSAR